MRDQLVITITIVAFLVGTPSMADSTFTTMDMEGLADWVTNAILDPSKNEDPVKTIESALISTSANVAAVTEEDIDEVIEADLLMLRREFELGDLDVTEDEYQKIYAEAENPDREEIRQELSDTEADVNVESGVAACEYLSALLGRPTGSFVGMLEGYGAILTEPYKKVRATMNRDELHNLVPAATTLLEKIRSEDAGELFNLYGDEEISSLENSLKNLYHNLTLIRESDP